MESGTEPQSINTDNHNNKQKQYSKLISTLKRKFLKCLQGCAYPKVLVIEVPIFRMYDFPSFRNFVCLSATVQAVS